LYDYEPLLATFALTWHPDSNMIKLDQKCQTCSKMVIQKNHGPIISYIDTITNTGPLQATIDHIWPILSQSNVHAIACYTRPRSLNSALKCTNSLKLDIVEHSWPPLPTTGHTGPVDAILGIMFH